MAAVATSPVLATAVREAAARFGDRAAFVDADGRTLSYRALHRRARMLAAGMAAAGVRPGSTVATVLPSSLEHVLVVAAAAAAGAATASVNPRLPQAQRAELLDIVDGAFVIDALDRVTELIHLGSARAVPPAPPPDPDRVAAIVFSSGTSGIPKGAVFTDRELAAVVALDTGGRWGDPREPPVHQLVATELVHVGFATKLPWYLRLGMTTHLLPRWRADQALDLIEEHRIPVAGGIAPQVALMLRDERFAQRDLSCVTKVIGAGAASSPTLIRQAIIGFGAPYSIRYSSTESGGLGTVADIHDADEDDLVHTVGTPRPGIDLQVRDGEVWLRSPTTMRGYVGAPDETSQTLVDGWLRTGDRGEVDDRGRLVLHGRGSETFIRGGYNVFPARVEAALREHPLVADVAVVPRPDPVMGQVGVAVVVPTVATAAPSLARLRDDLASRLAKHELPEDLVVVEALPLTSMHKIDRRALRDLVT